jgi:hypothetical protein
MLNPHIPSRNEKNAQKLKQNEFFASHARAGCRLLKTPTFILAILKTAIFEILSVAKALKVVENLSLLG